MSGVYIPGAFSKKKEVLQSPPIHVEVPAETIKKEEQTQQKPLPPKEPKEPKPTIVEIKPVEVKQVVWGGGKKSFAECLKTVGEEPNEIDKKNEKGKEVKPLLGYSISQKEVKKEELEFFMEKYNSKLKKLYDNAIYYDKEFFDKLRINGEQGYISFCKFMFHVI
jgi:hypothetical protein